MAYLKSTIDANYFWKDPAGKTVFYPEGKSKSGYCVDSGADESKIRALLEIYLSAAVTVNLLGYAAGYSLGQFLIHVFFARPAVHLPGVMGIMAGCLFILLIAPALYLRKLYGRAAAIYTAGLTEGPPCPPEGRRRFSWVLAALGVFLLVIGLGLAVLVRNRS